MKRIILLILTTLSVHAQQLSIQYNGPTLTLFLTNSVPHQLYQIQTCTNMGQWEPVLTLSSSSNSTSQLLASSVGSFYRTKALNPNARLYTIQETSVFEGQQTKVRLASDPTNILAILWQTFTPPPVGHPTNIVLSVAWTNIPTQVKINSGLYLLEKL